MNVLYIADIPDVCYENIDFSEAGKKKKESMVKSLMNSGHSVDIYSPLASERTGRSYYRSRQSKFNNVDVMYSPAIVLYPIINYLFSLLYSIYYAIVLFNKDYDVVLFYNYDVVTAIPAMIIRRIHNKPIVVEYEDAYSTQEDFYSQLTSWIRTTAKVSGGLLVCENMSSLVTTENYGVFRGIKEIYDSNLPSGELDFLDIDNSDTVVMYSGGLTREKGIDLFIKLAEFNSHSDIKFVSTGYGSPSTVHRIRSKFQDINSDDTIFLGKVSPYSRYVSLLERADILVVLEDPAFSISRYRFPSKIIEYTERDSVIVSSNISDLDKITPCPCYLLPAYDVKSVSSEITHIHNNLDKYKSTHDIKQQTWIENECNLESASHTVDTVLKQAMSS
ncbi:glycosyltransferase [Halorubrum sp. GN11GM_10-3_MGM]|uniref:glycosyltransferase n=1 Tax=Halorubrum sp. GN11GM_10-3_MGM TaxID=2518111 RepID=UPI0010F5AF94|nr:glycosyltransferase [Halorubrum sp. GN11GM_10-3_MGM]TKX69192.1 glycosyltransferase [Halorubrum sp. GN11GM_10-3_MGM]